MHAAKQYTASPGPDCGVGIATPPGAQLLEGIGAPGANAAAPGLRASVTQYPPTKPVTAPVTVAGPMHVPAQSLLPVHGSPIETVRGALATHPPDTGSHVLPDAHSGYPDGSAADVG